MSFINEWYAKEYTLLSLVLDEWQCSTPISKGFGVRYFQDDERKKYNGNVCCRVVKISTIVEDELNVDNEALARQDYEEDDDTNIKERYCNQRDGYS